MAELFSTAFANLMTGTNIFLMLVGVVVGIIFGCVPGLSAAMAIALFLPVTFGLPQYSAFALLMALSLFGYSWFSYQQTASSQPQMAGMKFMMVYLMPIMMLFWFNSYSSGLCYYYLLSNLFTIGQTLVIRRMVDDQKIHAIMQANAARKSKGKKSKFQQRYEELLRQQEAQQRAKRK